MDNTNAWIEKRIHTIPIYNSQAFEGMRKAGKLASNVLDFITPFVKEGVTTEKLDTLCETFIRDHGAIPAPLGYKGYPKSVCISPNHVVCHGIPSSKQLKEGDILNIDVTVILDGWHGDTSRMFEIEKVPIKAKRLIEITKSALSLAIQAVKPCIYLGDIGAIIQDFIEHHHYSVVRDFCGHGIGRVFHDAPQVLHFGKPKTGIMLETGMIFTIEPMVNIGTHHVKMLADGWTAVTKDKSLSAQFEHTIGVTDTGYEIFT